MDTIVNCLDVRFAFSPIYAKQIKSICAFLKKFAYFLFIFPHNFLLRHAVEESLVTSQVLLLRPYQVETTPSKCSEP